MQETVIAQALQAAGLDENTDHEQITVYFTDSRKNSKLNLYMNMVRLNDILIDAMEVTSRDDEQQVVLKLHGNIKEPDMRRLLCQLGKEANEFKITALQ